MNKYFSTLTIVLSFLLCLSLVWIGGCMGHRNGLKQCPQCPEVGTDTVVITDTIVYHTFSTDTVTQVVKVPYLVAVHDTLVDSIWVELPIERHHTSVPDTADIWYSGFDSKIDSMKFYCRNTVVTNNILQTEYKMPVLNLNVGAGALYYDGSINPYLLGELRCNAKQTTFGAYGAIDHQGRWGAGLNVTYRINIIK